MSKGTIMLSPHSDDVAIQAFGVVTKGLLPAPVTLLTVFSSSNWMAPGRRSLPNPRTVVNLFPRPIELVRSVARNRGRLGGSPRSILGRLLDLREPYKVTRIRLVEDMGFAKMIGMRFRYFSFPCSKLRHGRPIMDPNWSMNFDQDLWRKLLPALREVISRVNPEIVVAPWPYGAMQHIDHRIVYEAASEIGEVTGVRVGYLDDQPYGRLPLRPMTDERGHLYSPQVVRLSLSELKRKRKAMSIYWSQMTPGYYKAVGRAPPGSPDLTNSETLWRPS